MEFLWIVYMITKNDETRQIGRAKVYYLRIVRFLKDNGYLYYIENIFIGISRNVSNTGYILEFGIWGDIETLRIGKVSDEEIDQWISTNLSWFFENIKSFFQENGVFLDE